jgi:hypothetical protein
MRKHNGMRPQDIAVLLKIITSNNNYLPISRLSYELHLSLSEISESLNRSRLARLIDEDKKKVFRQSLLEFLIHGLKYVFPMAPGPSTKGFATAHSHPFMKQKFDSTENYVWPDPDGDLRGLEIEPLYTKLPRAAILDPEFYKCMALTDVLRVGRNREQKVAIDELSKLILKYEPSK